MSKLLLVMFTFPLVLPSPSRAQVTQLVSLDPLGAQASGTCSFPSISADAACVAFVSVATDLVPADTNGFSDVFVRDRTSGTTELVSVDSHGGQGNGMSLFPSISADGRWVAFSSTASNLVPGDTNGCSDVFVRDRQGGTTERVSVHSAGAQGNGASSYPAITADGRWVVFQSLAGSLVAGDTNGYYDVFVRDREDGTTERVSVNSGGQQGNGSSTHPSISADGRYVAFSSWATYLVPGDTNGWSDVFFRDRHTHTTGRLSVAAGGFQANGSSYTTSISADGRHVAFWSQASNLVPADSNGRYDVFVRNRHSGTTARVSVASGGAQGNGDAYNPWISADGRCVAFSSYASNLVPEDTNGSSDAFLHDLESGTTDRLSVAAGGLQGNDDSTLSSISADGRFVAFWSNASNLVPGDTNWLEDVFVRDRLGGTAFTSLCDPGVEGVVTCPCSNPPAGPGRGCDNSAATGGAILSASGGAYLSSDSLVFTTSGEMPAEASLVMQSNALLPLGLVYGNGVRCLGGELVRLYVKTASGGSITAPDFAAGDPGVSARSAARGVPIQPGQSRWYVVTYRDPGALGDCPSSSQINATQTGEILWSP